MHTTNQISRYSRQLLVPTLGVEGQKRLLQASVLVVGAGAHSTNTIDQTLHILPYYT